MERRHLQYFLAVSDEGSISAAARSLRLSQPSVSQAIQELESELECQLFVRGRGMTLTSGGRALIGPARAALRALDAARWAAASITELRSGDLDIGSVVHLAVDPLVGLLADYRVRHPGIRIRVSSVGAGSRGFDALSRGDIEILLGEYPPPATGYQVTPMGHREVMVVCPPGTPLPDRPFRLEETQSRDWIAALTPGVYGRKHLNDLLVERGLNELVPVLETAHRHSIVPLVLAGVGSAMLSRAEAETAASLGAVIRPLDADIPTGYALYHRPDNLSPAARAFVVQTRQHGENANL
ncbi:LysR family transcriptional regulator [Rhodococcus gannanensis]|uniref:LysR family transcriptional regulator n=1 Tax=Rhodococcus gannanensis TaxID=1960308 RepID=A0ABW4NY19_9NOCA